MKKKWLLPVTSLLANTYYVLAWVYVFNIFETHQERRDAFMRYMPKGFSNGFLSVLLIILSVISILIASRMNTKSRITTGFILLQVFFTFLLIWQFL